MCLLAACCRLPATAAATSSSEKMYIMDMFPYPSGSGLHVGHPLGYIATDVVAQTFLVDTENENTVSVLRTSRGDLCFPAGKTNVILATGTVPAATILLNSLPATMAARAGSRLTGHFLTHIAARFPIDPARYPTFKRCPNGIRCDGKCGQTLQIAASYLAGEDPKTNMQYHVQITAIHSPHPKWDAVDAGRECPDYAAAATFAQLEGSEDHIVLGELSNVESGFA